MREGKGFLLVYSVTSRSSFDDIAAFKDKILRAKDVDNVPIVLVGNKCDLEAQRQVAANEGKELARQWGCSFMETSAKERVRRAGLGSLQKSGLKLTLCVIYCVLLHRY